MEPLITRAELAEKLHCSERTIRRLLPKLRGVNPVMRGRMMLFTPADVTRLIDALRQPVPPATADARTVRDPERDRWRADAATQARNRAEQEAARIEREQLRADRDRRAAVLESLRPPRKPYGARKTSARPA